MSALSMPQPIRIPSELFPAPRWRHVASGGGHMTSTADKTEEIVAACDAYGDRDIIVLSGVPATGKSYISSIAAEKVAQHPGFVLRTQFHPGYSYEDLIEGLRPRVSGGYEV